MTTQADMNESDQAFFRQQEAGNHQDDPVYCRNCDEHTDPRQGKAGGRYKIPSLICSKCLYEY